MITDIYLEDDNTMWITISFDKDFKRMNVCFKSYEGQEYSLQQVFKNYTTNFLIITLKELCERLNDLPEENEISIIKFLNEKLTKEIFRRFEIAEKQSDQRKKLLYQMNLTIAVIDKSKEKIMKKIKEK